MIIRELTNPETDQKALDEMHSDLAMMKKIDSLFKKGNKNWFFRDFGKANQTVGIEEAPTKFESNRRSHAVEATDSINLIEETKVSFKGQTTIEVTPPDSPLMQSPKIKHKMSDTSSKPLNLLV